VRRALVLLALGVVAAGCGQSNPATKIYNRAKTQACLAAKQVRVGGTLDFVASTATGGAFKAHPPGNVVTVVFGQTLSDATNINQAYVHFHAQNVGIADVLRQQGNAVMLWHVHPSDDDLSLIQGCLTS
jgi:hypothetical protein